MKGSCTYFDIIRLQQGTAVPSPVGLELEKDFLKSQHRILGARHSSLINEFYLFLPPSWQLARNERRGVAISPRLSVTTAPLRAANGLKNHGVTQQK
ncbi:hypothetical protein [Deefgea sp. CFH1-16]|uniref:hypothetical protein n=1 Tax=Deefgea sp. CFH1-16 TaxID=2675457 RepID=UPI00194028E3|nr:hypothetical protein [Deefgea sp. CFH1-16]